MSEQTADLIAELDVLVAETTPTPWENRRRDIRQVESADYVMLSPIEGGAAGDTDFIVALVNAWPRIRAALERAESDLNDALDHPAGWHSCVARIRHAEAERDEYRRLHDVAFADASKMEARLSAIEGAARDAERLWWHEAHGLHEEVHHQAHRPLDLCVPLLGITLALRAALGEHREERT